MLKPDSKGFSPVSSSPSAWAVLPSSADFPDNASGVSIDVCVPLHYPARLIECRVRRTLTAQRHTPVIPMAVPKRHFGELCERILVEAAVWRLYLLHVGSTHVIRHSLVNRHQWLFEGWSVTGYVRYWLLRSLLIQGQRQADFGESRISGSDVQVAGISLGALPTPTVKHRLTLALSLQSPVTQKPTHRRLYMQILTSAVGRSGSWKALARRRLSHLVTPYTQMYQNYHSDRHEDCGWTEAWATTLGFYHWTLIVSPKFFTLCSANRATAILAVPRDSSQLVILLTSLWRSILYDGRSWLSSPCHQLPY